MAQEGSKRGPRGRACHLPCGLGQVLLKARTCASDIGDLMLEESPALAGMVKKISNCRDMYVEAQKLRILQK